MGRPSKVSASDLQRLTNQEDLIHEEPYEIQAKTLDGQPSARTLQAHASRAGARRFKKRYTTEVSRQNKSIRVEYGKKHENDTLTGFWQFIGFTDKSYFLSVKLPNKAKYKLRFPSQEWLLKKTKITGLNVTIHHIALVIYNFKGKLIFYKDLKELLEKPYKPHKP